MINDKLASHISSKLWNVSKDEIVDVLASYSEELDYSTIYSSKPNDIEERVTALELAILPTKRNLSIDTHTPDWKEIFERDKTVINCESEEEAKELLKIADGLGYKWSSGIGYNEEKKWFEYKKETCYDIISGKYCDIEGYTEDNYTILSYRDIIAPKQDDWKKVECLSWEDVDSFHSKYGSASLGANLKTYIKNKLKK